MSKTKLLLDVVWDLRSFADSVQAMAEATAADEPAQPEKSVSSAM